MKMEFISNDLLRQVCKAVRASPMRCRIAVAFLGKGGARRMPLGRGSRLVVNLSEASARAGLTHGGEVLKFLNRGVDVFTVSNLHAKVFVVGRRAFVGSANLSQHAHDRLIEAGLATTEAKVVAACRRFVDSLTGSPVTPEEARRLAKLFRPRGGEPRKARFSDDATPDHGTVWIVPLAEQTWDDEDNDEADAGRPKARTQIRSHRFFEIDEFCWAGKRWTDRIREGEQVIQIMRTKNRTRYVHAVGRIVLIRRYKVGRSGRAIVFLQYPKRVRRLRMERLLLRMGRGAGFLRRLAAPTMRLNSEFKHRLLNALPKPSSPRPG